MKHGLLAPELPADSRLPLGMEIALPYSVPTISRFFGIVIRMHFDVHSPPHFHAHYREFKASIRIDPLAVLDGHLPPRALGMVVEWGRLHSAALLSNWERARDRKPLDPVPPLD